MPYTIRPALNFCLTDSAAAGWNRLLIPMLMLVLVGCASTTHRAPVEDRGPATRTQSAGTTVGASSGASSGASAGTPAGASAIGADATPAKPLPGAENAGKPGYYSVRPGDTLIRIGLESGQNWRDIARWSGLDNPNAIEVGQVLRVTPPTTESNGAVTRPVAASGRVDGKPLDGKPAVAAGPAGAATVPASGPAASPSAGAASPGGPLAAAPGSTPPLASTPTPPPAAAPREGDEDINWAWPASGPVATPFDDVKSKGLGISGKAGDAVLAAADGRVVYAGSGLRGYGNLVIVKHNATFLTAYAHNQTLMVKEDQVVRRGQKIAEMGSSDADKVQLHFEIRRQGKPVDPARLLPPR